MNTFNNVFSTIKFVKNSSVTISSELRKRIKRLAAKRDTSQSKIIELAVNMLENKWNQKSNTWNEKELSILKSIEEEVFQKNPSRKRRAKILEQSDIDIDEAIISTWDTDLIDKDDK